MTKYILTFNNLGTGNMFVITNLCNIIILQNSYLKSINPYMAETYTCLSQNSAKQKTKHRHSVCT